MTCSLWVAKQTELIWCLCIICRQTWELDLWSTGTLPPSPAVVQQSNRQIEKNKRGGKKINFNQNHHTFKQQSCSSVWRHPPPTVFKYIFWIHYLAVKLLQPHPGHRLLIYWSNTPSLSLCTWCLSWIIQPDPTITIFSVLWEEL